jgi:phosphoenolpyruvate synthase/pyruvate phosphate dikinase
MIQWIQQLDLSAVVRDVEAVVAEQFGQVHLAVRSSSNMEDLKNQSFAGQYESFLDVPLANIEQAIRGCWLSLWQEEAVSYRGAATVRPLMAVIVQPFLRGALGGVAFSANPVTGNPFEFVIDHVDGSPAQVTDGSVATQVTHVSLFHVLARTAPEPFQTIAEACLKFAGPVDVEWLWSEGNGLYILQARPIARTRKFVADKPVVAGYVLALPEPLSRLGASLEFDKNRIYQAMVSSLGLSLRRKMLVVYGRHYLFDEETRAPVSIFG